MTATIASDAGTGSRRARGPQAYDFRRPNKVSRDQMRSLEMMHETFARQFSTALSTTLRTMCHVSLASVQQATYDEYVGMAANPTYLALLALDPLVGASLFNMPLPLVMSMVDRLLGGSGGSGDGGYPNRPLTEIESGLLRGIMERILAEFAGAFESLCPMSPRIVQQEHNPAFAQIAGPADMMVVAVYEVRVGATEDVATLCIPFATLEPVLEQITNHSMFAERNTEDPTAVLAALHGSLEDAPVEVTVRFNTVTLASSEILDLRIGDVLPLHHPTDASLQVAVAGIPYFSAVAGRKGKRLACMIVDNPGVAEA